jgi:nucleoside 2-deoxyribosyltransferase
MKLYFAAPYAARDLVRESLAPLFTRHGHELVSEWLLGTREITPESVGTAPMHTDDEAAAHAIKDLAEIRAADALIHFTADFLVFFSSNVQDTPLDPHEDRLHTGGRHVETGYALALGRPIIIIGEPENIFQRSLTHVPNTMRALEELRKIETGYREDRKH